MLYYIYGRENRREDEEGAGGQDSKRTTEAVRAIGIRTNDV
jgi:hypothetical protein